MPIHNLDIANILNEVADLLEIEGANTSRVRAYRNAARTIGMLSSDVAEQVKEGADLTKLDGIGDSLAEKVVEVAHV
jgi:DNA polymerase (family 10)